jgi:hypothetical protein
MHYTPNVDLAFISVEHIMRDVNSGWFLRYTHANVASFFFLFLYFHTARGLYYSSYKTPRVLLWSIGVIILILTMAIAFLGYVLPYGQMSLWGCQKLASNVNHFFYIFNLREWIKIVISINNTFPWGPAFWSAPLPFAPLPLPKVPCRRHPYGKGRGSLAAQAQGCEGKGEREETALIICSNSAYNIFRSACSALAFSLVPLIIKNKTIKQKTGAQSAQTMTLVKGLGERRNRIRSEKRIGPHNFDILSIIFGSLLGDGHAEKRLKGNGTRISFYQEGSHLTYLIWLHKLISSLGYCSPQTPTFQTRLGKKGVVRKIVRFNTWTYSSLDWIHELWYKPASGSGDNLTLKPENFTFSRLSCRKHGVALIEDKTELKYIDICLNKPTEISICNPPSTVLSIYPCFALQPSDPRSPFLKQGAEGRGEGKEENKKRLVKRVPKNIYFFLTPLALAIWIMDDGGKVGKGLKFATNSFSYEDCLYLVKILDIKYNLKASVQNAGKINQYHIYIWKESIDLLREIVLPFIHPSMKYKLI